MDADEINAKLALSYEQWRISLKPGNYEMMTAPLLVAVTDAFARARTRVLIVGQETRGWGWDHTQAQLYGEPVDRFPFEELWKFEHFLDDPIAVKALQWWYGRFDFANYLPDTRRSPLWRTFRHFNRLPNTQAIWINLCHVAYDDPDGKRYSFFRFSEDVRNSFISSQRPILRAEIEIIDPNVCIFLTGPSYDCILRASFENSSLEAIDGFEPRLLARVVHPDLPVCSFRTYHPGYLNRRQQLKGIWDALESLISCAIDSGC